VTDAGQHFFWLASRATGVVALVLVAVSVGIGLAMAARVIRAPGAMPRLKVLHESVALMSLIAIVAHGLLLLGDGYLSPSIADLAVPFAIGVDPLWNGIGIIAGWLAVILGLSFYVRRHIGTKLWRWLHRWTLLVYVLGVGHALGAGTDAGSWWLLGILGATLLPIVFLATYRFFPGEDAPRRAGRTARAPLESGA
jgi:predicted ferric reductase